MPLYEVQASAATVATPEQIWTVLDNYSGWPRWMPGTQGLRFEPLDDVGLRAGHRFRISARLSSAVLQIQTLEPFERATTFELSVLGLTLRGHNRCRLLPLADGRYRVERADALHLPALAVSLIDATARDRFARLAAEFLRDLIREAENTSIAAGSPGHSANPQA